MSALFNLEIEDDLGVCIKNLDGEVLQQNKACLDICGDCLGKVCTIACMELYAKDETRQWDKWGSRVYANSFAHDGYYDITLLCSNVQMITLLQPLEKQYQKALAYYESLNLTKREIEILSYVIKGASNLEICKCISISKSTIKTHLNNIYKKVNEKGIELKYLPKNRMSPSVYVYLSP